MTENKRTDLDLLVAVARGVIELTSIARSSTFRLPYPPSIQLALDQMVLLAMTRGRPIPAGVPDLMSWCREREPQEWGLELPHGFLTPGVRLIHPTVGEPSRTCAEVASLGSHGGPEQEAETLLAGLAGTCGTVERFAACRDFLIRRPVILRPDPMELLRPAVAQTWNLVKGLYAPVPDRFAADRLVCCCTGCGLLANAVTAGGPWCEGGCPAGDHKLDISHEPQSAVALPFALRLFLALPGRIEQVVRSRLTDQAELLPLGSGVHSVVGQDGALRTFQVHDREQPGPAALRAAEVAAVLDKPLDIVVADGVGVRPGYRVHFDRALPAGAQVRLLTVSDFTAPESADRTRRNYA
ncbi:pPIWI_RE_Y domain-containing protein [Streptomyces sp. SID1121]|uniref:pPIWI_RE_Y domain-containing protein n=1 Tax=Streptomyces sp. SID1121 TaxID=3425888 RepID=UPI0040577BDA